MITATRRRRVDPDVIDGVCYPSSDGKPMGETGLHVLALLRLFELLRKRYADRQDVYVAGNMFLYWEKGNPKACNSPDVMVNFGVRDNEERRSFRCWSEGVVPRVTFEMASKKTWRKHLGKTKDEYESLGIREYFLFDPEDVYLPEQIMGFRLIGKRYRRLDWNMQDGMISRVLGLRMFPHGRHLQLFALSTNEQLLTDAQERDREMERAHLEKLRADEEQRRADEEKRRADDERRRADSVQNEVDNLRAQINRRHAGPNGQSNGSSLP